MSHQNVLIISSKQLHDQAWKERVSDTCLLVNSIATVPNRRRTSDAEMDAPLMQLLEVTIRLADPCSLFSSYDASCFPYESTLASIDGQEAPLSAFRVAMELKITAAQAGNCNDTCTLDTY